MVIKADIPALKKTSWDEYGIRFLFGGIATVIAGLIARHYGPELGGLFLAFPAIAPATATLLDQHVKEERQRAGLEGHARGRKTAALDMFGTVWGTVGLLGFALVIWLVGPHHSAWIVLPVAMAVWLVGALSTWEVRRVLKRWKAARRHEALVTPVSISGHK